MLAVSLSLREIVLLLAYAIEILCSSEDGAGRLENVVDAVALVIADVDGAVIQGSKDLLPCLNTVSLAQNTLARSLLPTYQYKLLHNTPVLDGITQQIRIVANGTSVLVERNAAQDMRRRLDSSLAVTGVLVVHQVQAEPGRHAFLASVLRQNGGGLLVEQGGESGTRAAQDGGVQLVAARTGDEDQDVAVGEVWEVVVHGGGRRG